MEVSIREQRHSFVTKVDAVDKNLTEVSIREQRHSFVTLIRGSLGGGNFCFNP
ncbi:MAG: hypothetical protein FD122_3258 [Stygiobacter sp.]|nr:MAG: hypothetical protein FD122_3258 [Stygiobacter sp.]KAF0215419.1 MAG: hypothetical protein FD178_1703 [Ignavibacteria bacterium]